MAEYKVSLKFTDNTGNERVFRSEPNMLVPGKHMYWFEPHPSMYVGTLREVKSIVKQLKANKEKLKHNRETRLKS